MHGVLGALVWLAACGGGSGGTGRATRDAGVDSEVRDAATESDGAIERDAPAGDTGDVDAAETDAGAPDAGDPDPPGDPPADPPPPDDPAPPPPDDPGACVATAEPAPETGCPYPLEVVMWAAQAWNVLGDAFAANTSPCGNYFVSVPPIVGDKTNLRAGEAARMRARGARIHPLAEFHWQAWAAWRRDRGTTWTEAGLEFRRRMEAAGYCVQGGDGWAINEVPTTVRTDPAVRAGFMELVLALRDGDPGMPVARGAAFVWNMGHATMGFSVYEPSVRAWLTDRAFWERMNLAVRWWGQETYVDPRFSCVPGSTLDARADHVSEFSMHPARLAAAAPDDAGANTAQSYFSRAYFPLLNSVWDSTPANGYGDTTMPIDEMIDHVSEQVYSTRRWADAHPYPDGRIGFAFASYHDPPEWPTVAAHVARAVRNAYGRGNEADAACWEDGARSWCTCSKSGAVFNDGWATFGSW